MGWFVDSLPYGFTVCAYSRFCWNLGWTSLYILGAIALGPTAVVMEIRTVGHFRFVRTQSVSVVTVRNISQSVLKINDAFQRGIKFSCWNISVERVVNSFLFAWGKITQWMLMFNKCHSLERPPRWEPMVINYTANNNRCVWRARSLTAAMSYM